MIVVEINSSAIGIQDVKEKLLDRYTKVEYKDTHKIKPKFDVELDIYSLAKGADIEYCMHCDTEEKAIIFCNYLHTHGRIWANGTPYCDNTYWNIDKELSCYGFMNDLRGNIAEFKLFDSIVLEFDDYNWE